MAGKTAARWAFAARFRAGAYSWDGSALAARRLKEAVAEIRTAARQDPVVAGEGAVRLMEKLWPALAKIDTSSGALGSAVCSAVHALIDVCVAAPADTTTRARWLARLWAAIEEDGVEYLEPVVERWGEVCGSPERAVKWAESVMPTVLRIWADTTSFSYYRGTTACLSCLLVAGRHTELLELLEQAPRPYWHFRCYGVRALAAMGRIDEAIAYAQQSAGLNEQQMAIDATCEELLLAAGRTDEAYESYALHTTQAGTNLATLRAIQKRYPAKDPQVILHDLVAASPGQEGKWFAAAKELGLYDVALALVTDSPCDPRTLNRAARDFVTKNSRFALGAALASIRWMTLGYGYEITTEDAREAVAYLLQSASLLGEREEAREAVRPLIDRSADPSLRGMLKRAMGFPTARTAR